MNWLGLCCFLAFNQGTLSVEQQREDLKALRAGLEERHAGLYVYINKDQLDHVFSRIEASLEPRSDLAFYAQIFLIIAAIRDGHTQLSLSASTEQALANQRIRLPFKLWVRNGRVWLNRNYTNRNDIEMGSELLSINDHPTGEIIRGMLPLFSADGDNVSLKYRRMESTFWFGLRFRLLYGGSDEFRIVYRERKSGALKQTTVKGLTSDELNTRYRKRYQAKDDAVKPATLTFDDDLAIFDLNSFQASSVDGQNWQQWFASSFEKIKQNASANLVIDVRGNGGGSDTPGRVLMQYLTSKPFQYYLSRKDSKGKDVPHRNMGIHQPLSPGFRGKVFILLDGFSYSAASEFLTAAHQQRVGRFIGDESAGAYIGNTSGNTTSMTLPNSGIRVFIPTVRYTLPAEGYPRPRLGLTPDYWAPITIDDHLDGKDPAMNLVKQLVDLGK